MRRAVLGPKHAAPSSIVSSAGGKLGIVSTCRRGERRVASLPVWVGSSPPCVLSVVVGLGSFETSSEGLPRRLRRLFLFLPPWRFLALLVRPRGRGRAVRLILGLGLPFL